MRKLLCVLALVAVLAPGAAADRSLDGSYVQLITPDPAIFDPGEYYVADFYVFNGSEDAEWIVEVWFLFPECFHVTGGSFTPDPGVAGSWDFQFDTFGSPDNGALFYDANGGNGEIWGEEGGLFHVYLTIPTGCNCRPDEVEWYMEGDTWGGPPHWMDGSIDIRICDETAVKESDWSVIKSLY